MLRVTVVIPTYNEAENLVPLVEEIFSIVDKNRFDFDIVFVDDNSPDGTGKIAEELRGKYPVSVIHREKKLGLGSAVRSGFSISTSEILGVMDADLSHDPSIINEMLTSIGGGVDIVLGSRFQETSVVEQWKWWRKIISEVGVFFTRALTGVKDPLSGYFFFKRKVIDGVQLDTVGYKILLEILIKGHYEKIKEIPFKFRIRKFSASKLEAKEYWLFLSQIVRYGWYKLVKIWKK